MGILFSKDKSLSSNFDESSNITGKADKGKSKDNTSKLDQKIENLNKNFEPNGGFGIELVSNSVQRNKLTTISAPIVKPLSPTAFAAKNDIERFAEEAINKNACPEEVELIVKRAIFALHNAPDDPTISKIKDRAIKAINQFTETVLAASEVGHKAANLKRLQSIFEKSDNIIVPYFLGLKHETILGILKNNFRDFDEIWDQFVSHIKEGKSLDSAEFILSQLQQGITKAFDNSHKFLSDAELLPFEDKPLMVRSSGREDTLKVANPGGNESVSNVMPTQEEISKAVITVVSSYFSQKSFAQRQASGDDITMVPFIPVLLQTMVGEKLGHSIPVSGVLFSTEGDLNTDGVSQICAGYGHAEGIVTGSQTSDTFYVQKGFVHQIIQSKDSRKIPLASGLLGVVANPKEIHNKACLDNEQLQTLASIGKRLEESYGYPVDAEWSYDPSNNTFFIFQARPISEKPPMNPSYINPESIGLLQDIQQVVVIGAGTGELLLLKDICIANNAPEALKAVLKNPEIIPQAILLANSTARNSHEAAFFRSRGIPVIHLPGTSYDNCLTKLNEGNRVVIDTQEGILGILAENVSLHEIALPGLRRHLAPKMESINLETKLETFESFLKAISLEAENYAKELNPSNSRLISKQEDKKVQGGWNVIDKLLNEIEMAQDSSERAYLLSNILKKVKLVLMNMPAEDREGVQIKILSCAENVWETFNDSTVDEIGRKFAINWLRAALVHRPADGVVNAQTLYTEMDAQKERKLLQIITPIFIPENEKERETIALRDILLRSKKMIISAEGKDQWNTFLSNLNENQLRMLSTIIGKLGSSVTQVWLNSSFLSTFRSQPNSQQCLKSLLAELSGDNVAKTLEFAKSSKIIAARYKNRSEEFGDPIKFPTLLASLNAELLSCGIECFKLMDGATGITATLLAHSCREIVSAYDDCIKSLTGSPSYNNISQKSNNFAQILEGYHTLTLSAFEPGVLQQDEVLLDQGTRLKEIYMQKSFDNLKKQSQLNPSKSMEVSKDFSVNMVALGSGFAAYDRNPPQSLEDYFTFLHQSLIAATLSVDNRAGIKLSDCPLAIHTLVNSIIGGLDLQNAGKLELDNVGIKSSVQSIEYNYPNIKVYLNCPLKNHCGQFCISSKVNFKGEIIDMVFDGNFYAGVNLRGMTGRGNTLFFYALQSYYPTYENEFAMVKPPNYDLKPSPNGESCQFKWQIPLNGSDIVPEFLTSCNTHLQRLIDALQLTPKVITEINIPLLDDHPWVLQMYNDSKIPYEMRGDLAKAFIAKIDNFYTTERAKILLQNFSLFSDWNMPRIINNIFYDDAFWTEENFNEIKIVLPLIQKMVKEKNIDQEFLNLLFNRIKTMYLIPLNSNYAIDKCIVDIRNEIFKSVFDFNKTNMMLMLGGKYFDSIKEVESYLAQEPGNVIALCPGTAPNDFVFNFKMSNNNKAWTVVNVDDDEKLLDIILNWKLLLQNPEFEGVTPVNDSQDAENNTKNGSFSIYPTNNLDNYALAFKGDNGKLGQITIKVLGFGSYNSFTMPNFLSVKTILPTLQLSNNLFLTRNSAEAYLHKDSIGESAIIFEYNMFTMIVKTTEDTFINLLIARDLNNLKSIDDIKEKIKKGAIFYTNEQQAMEAAQKPDAPPILFQDSMMRNYLLQWNSINNQVMTTLIL